MALISIIVGILLDRYWPPLQQWRRFDWFPRYNQWLLAKTDNYLHNPTAKYLSLLATPVLAIMILQQMADDWLGLLSLLFAIVVFVYCLGSLEIEQKLEALIRAVKNNDNPAAALAEITDETHGDENLADDALRAVLNSAIEKLFGVMFWFAILGPLGAVLYRFSQLLQQQYRDDPLLSAVSERMLELLNWLPSRILCFSFAVTGHFEGALAAYHENRETDRTQRYLLIDICHGALEGNDKDDTAAYLIAFRGMLLRSLIVWLAFIAVLTLIGWS